MARTTQQNSNESANLLPASSHTYNGNGNTSSISITQAKARGLRNKHFPGPGTYDEHIHVDDVQLSKAAHALERQNHPHEMLGPWMASSICGNDILSSCFYSIGLVTSYAGQLAP